MPGEDETCQRLGALAQTLFPPHLGTDFGIAVRRITPDSVGHLMGQEISDIAQAVPARRAEFATGRLAARVALRDIGRAPVALPMGSDRAPVWPAGVTGSISHAGGLCIAVVASGPRSLGVDLETDQPLDLDLRASVLFGAECALPEDRTIVAFSIKEAVYKAVFLQAREVFGFDGVNLAIGEGRFVARLALNTGGFRAGDTFSGKWGRDAGFVLSGVVV